MKRKWGPAIGALVLAAFVAMTGVADAKKLPKSSWARNGCHMMALAFSGHAGDNFPYYVGDAQTQFKHARAAYRATSEDTSSLAAVQAWIVRVGALCKADFPADPVVQQARYPTNTTT